MGHSREEGSGLEGAQPDDLIERGVIYLHRTRTEIRDVKPSFCVGIGGNGEPFVDCAHRETIRVGVVNYDDPVITLKLPRFCGHPTVWVFGVHNGKEAPTLRAGIPPADD
jgi:hypothetical protein